mgnify:CR=1 FL=1
MAHRHQQAGCAGIDGASVWSGQVTGPLEISLPKGFYVVRVGKTIRKVSL